MPEVERILRVCVTTKLEYDHSDLKIENFKRRIAQSGGMVVSHEELAGLHQRKQGAAVLLQSAFDNLQRTGVQVKDLEDGLIDFPTLYRDREVYLCWKLGEPAIQFWHAIDDGFPGRQPIDEEFLQNHRGDSLL